MSDRQKTALLVEAMKSRGKISAIRAYRSLTGCGLKEGWLAVEGAMAVTGCVPGEEWRANGILLGRQLIRAKSEPRRRTMLSAKAFAERSAHCVDGGSVLRRVKKGSGSEPVLLGARKLNESRRTVCEDEENLKDPLEDEGIVNT